MYQGQLCKILARPGRDTIFAEDLGPNGGWFLKLKGIDKKTRFCLVEQDRKREMSIDPSMVDESMRNEDPSKPCYVVCVIPANLQAMCLRVKPNIEEIAVRASLQSKISDFSAQHDCATQELKRARENLIQHEVRVIEVTEKMDELQQIAEMPRPSFMYAYGKHSADGQEYCWRVPYRLYNSVKAGSTVIADTKLGPANVVITRTEKSAYLLPHKLIVKMG